ncbi:MAG: HlyD family efflux transporter periplasmic adaptor subunit [Caldilineaceae bacterium]|nr:HlyD family efflux transporter periplasmic adaptor subunit [Caldilineaceae bacterium]
MLLLWGLAACNRQPTPTPMPIVTPLENPNTGPRAGASASGEIVPVQKAALSFPSAGRIQQVLVEEGDTVQMGEPLVMQEDALAQAAVTRAQAGLFQAQAQLSALVAGPRAQEIAIAQAAVDVAAAQLAQLTEAARPEEVMAARFELAAARAAQQQLTNGPTEADRINALAALSNAKAALQQARAAYNLVSWRNDIGALPESRQLQEATNNLEAAQARYDALYDQPTSDVAAAQARVQQAEAALDRLLNPGSQNQVAAAQAQLRAAQAQLDLLTAAARDEVIAEAAATVTQAEADLARAESDLANLTLRAPFTGTVTVLALNAGEMAQPGASVLTLADLTRLQVETTDFSERDISGVAPGQAATIFVEALNTELNGRVLRIAPQASIIGGDVVYTVVVSLAEQPDGLRWGMSVDVSVQAE